MRKRLIEKAAAVAMISAPFAIVPISSVLSADTVASQWSIGPTIKGRNYSVNMPPTLYATKDGAAFDFPYPTAGAGHVHYVTKPVRPLIDANRITLRYRIDSEPGTRFFQQEAPSEPATISLYFQQRGDRWTRRYPTHRWYSPVSREEPLRVGTHTISISLDEPWIAVLGGDAHTKPEAFERALEETATAGFTFGGNHGRGHGVFATRPAKFTLLEYRIE